MKILVRCSQAKSRDIFNRIIMYKMAIKNPQHHFFFLSGKSFWSFLAHFYKSVTFTNYIFLLHSGSNCSAPTFLTWHSVKLCILKVVLMVLVHTKALICVHLSLDCHWFWFFCIYHWIALGVDQNTILQNYISETLLAFYIDFWIFQTLISKAPIVSLSNKLYSYC